MGSLSLALKIKYRAVAEICGLLVSVVDEKIDLAHQTVKEFLFERKAQRQDWMQNLERRHVRWMHTFDIASAHRTLSTICIAYLRLPDFRYYGPVALVQDANQYLPPSVLRQLKHPPRDRIIHREGNTVLSLSFLC